MVWRPRSRHRVRPACREARELLGHDATGSKRTRPGVARARCTPGVRLEQVFVACYLPSVRCGANRGSRHPLIALCALACGCSAILGLDERVPTSNPTLTEAGSSVDAGNLVDTGVDVTAPVCGGSVCGAHAVCAGGACACVSGYASTAGGCVFRGGPRDPSFENMPAAWSVTGAAALMPQAQGANGLGTAFSDDDSSVSQTFDMPELRDAEPLALNLVGRRSPCGTNPMCVFPMTSSISYGPGDVGVGLADTKFTTSRVCLGDLAYGVKASLVLRGGKVGTTFDRADYVPDATCPAPGQVRDGNFTAPSGWGVTGNATIVDGVGVAGSRAGRLAGSADCAPAALTSEVSIPKAMANPALRFAHRGTGGRRLRANGASVPVSPSFTTSTICVPRSLKGYAFGLTFSVEAEAGTCAPYEVIVDDVSVVSSPGCGDGALFDGGFEGEPSHWQLSTSNAAQAIARVTSQQFTSRTGASSLELGGVLPPGGVLPCMLVRAQAVQSITVPEAVGTAGPAVFFWYASPRAHSRSTTRFSLGREDTRARKSACPRLGPDEACHSPSACSWMIARLRASTTSSWAPTLVARRTELQRTGHAVRFA